MQPLTEMGKALIVLGLLIVVVGLLMLLGDKIPFFGKLPGDIVIKRDNFTFYLPLTTSILLSILISLLLRLFKK